MKTRDEAEALVEQFSDALVAYERAESPQVQKARAEYRDLRKTLIEALMGGNINITHTPQDHCR